MKKNSGFTIIELLSAIVIIFIIGIMSLVTVVAIRKDGGLTENKTCVEWEDAKVTDCWSYGMGTTCESYIEKRCVRYDDGSGKTK